MKNQIIQELLEIKEIIEKARALQLAIAGIEKIELPNQESKIKSIDSKKESIGSFKFFYIFEIMGLVIGTSVFPVIGTIIGWVIGFIIRKLSSEMLFAIHFPGSKRKKLKAEVYYNNEMRKALEEKNNLLDRLSQLSECLMSIDKPEILDLSYCEIDIVEYLIRIIESGRADTLKEALNLYEDKLHKDNMIQLQQEQMRITQNSAEQQKKMVELQEKSLTQQNKQSKQLKYGNTLHTVNTIRHWSKK